MNFAQRFQFGWYAAAIALTGISACASGPKGTANLTPQQAALVRADSEVFEAVVRAQLAGTRKDYPYHVDVLRYNSRPSIPISAFPTTAQRATRPDTSGLFQTPDSVALDRLAATRKRILERAGVEEGGPFPGTNCAGMLVPPSPPAPGSGAPARPTPDVHAGCPQRGQNYITVSVPVRGLPEALHYRPNGSGRAVNVSGEVWTVVVEEKAAAAGGSMWSQHAWLFTRNPSNGRLQLADTILLGIAE